MIARHVARERVDPFLRIALIVLVLMVGLSVLLAFAIFLAIMCGGPP